MQEHELNQQKLADKLSITQATVSRWLLEKMEPTLENLWKLADLFETTADELIGRTDDYGFIIKSTLNNELTYENRRIIEAFKKLEEEEREVILDMIEVMNKNKIKEK